MIIMEEEYYFLSFSRVGACAIIESERDDGLLLLWLTLCLISALSNSSDCIQ